MSADRSAVAALAIDDLYAQFDAATMLALFIRLQSRVTSARYPALIVLPPDGNDEPGLQCPHCKRTLANGDSWAVDVDAVDLSWRSTRADQVDFTAHELVVHYDGTTDYDGLIYRCAECGEAVDLPEGWTEAL